MRWLMKERRMFPRLDEPALVNYTLLDDRLLQARSVSDDISEGGIRFPTDERLSPGSQVELEINIPSASLFLVSQGVIIWQKKLDKGIGRWCYVMGIKFIDMEPSDKEQLLCFLGSCLDKRLVVNN